MQRTRELLTLTKTSRISFSGEIIYKVDKGPYKYVCENENFVEAADRLYKVNALSWCSKDGEPIGFINADKFNIEFSQYTHDIELGLFVSSPANLVAASPKGPKPLKSINATFNIRTKGGI